MFINGYRLRLFPGVASDYREAMTKTNGRVDVGNSSDALMLAAERVVALRGYAGVTLREINEAAGARNASAVHFHFGSLDLLLQTVFKRRLSVVNTRRLEMLESVRCGDLRGFVEAMVRPLVVELMPRPEGNFYLRFLERLVLEGDLKTRLDLPADLMEGWRRAEQGIRQALPTIPPAVMDIRLELLRIHLTAGLAAAELRLEKLPSTADSLALFVATIIDASLAMVQTPVSVQAVQGLRSVHR